MLTVYRKYRAKNFSQIIGQDHVVSVLKQAVRDGKLSHAYLFTGPRGTGKTSMARILAKAVNCLNLKDGEPCNKCQNCLAINKGNFLDLIEIDAASNRGIDEIRELKNNIGFLPVEGKFKVYIIDEVHMLTEPAFNALLKTLEEPPSKVLFILATTEPQKIPLTIISRTQRFDFKLADETSLHKKLNSIIDNEKRSISKEAMQIIVRAGRGSFRDAETVLEKVISAFSQESEVEITKTDVETILGLASRETVSALIDLIMEDDRVGAFALLSQAESSGLNLGYFIREVLEETRQRMMKAIKDNGQGVLVKKYLQIVKEFNNASNEMRTSLVPILTIEVAIANLTPEANILIPSKDHYQKVQTEEKKLDTKIKRGVVNEKDHEVDKEVEMDIEVQITGLKQKWPAILDAAKKYNHFLTAILAKVNLDKDEEGMVLFKVGSGFHKKRLESKETRKILAGLFQEHCGYDVDYKCIIEVGKAGVESEKSNSKIVEEFFS